MMQAVIAIEILILFLFKAGLGATRRYVSGLAFISLDAVLGLYILYWFFRQLEGDRPDISLVLANPYLWAGVLLVPIVAYIFETVAGPRHWRWSAIRRRGRFIRQRKLKEKVEPLDESEGGAC